MKIILQFNVDIYRSPKDIKNQLEQSKFFAIEDYHYSGRPEAISLGTPEEIIVIDNEEE